MSEPTTTSIPALDQAARAGVQSLLDRKTKPTGSLGRLEELAVPDRRVRLFGVLLSFHQGPAKRFDFLLDHRLGVLAQLNHLVPGGVTRVIAAIQAHFHLAERAGDRLHRLRRRVAADAEPEPPRLAALQHAADWHLRGGIGR